MQPVPTEGIITIKKGREKPIIQQHPWIFSGAIAKAENANPGDIVTVIAQDGRFLGRGYWNAKSQIQVRILTWQDEPIDRDWWQRMLQRAIDARKQHNLAHAANNAPFASRLVNAENDYLPGLIVDRYDDWLVLQALTLGINHRKALLVELLADMLQPEGIYERSDVEVREREGLEQANGLLWGNEPPEYIIISEHDVAIQVDVRKGHKTGFYLDQKPNRHLLHNLITENYAGEDCHLLNLFSYTGGFALHAAQAGGVHITHVDTSYDALVLAEANAQLNSIQPASAQYLQADVFDYLRDAVKRRETYDVIVLDPPKFAQNKRQADRASRGYKDINLNAFKLVKPGGYLLTFSCSGGITQQLFQQIVFGALADSGRQAQIIRHLGPGEDHPNALTFPEGAYLKGLLLKVY